MSKNLPDLIRPKLKNLAKKFLKDESYEDLSTVAELLVGFNNDGWSELSEKDKEIYLEKMGQDFNPKGPIGDSKYMLDKDYLAILDLLEEERLKIRKIKT